VIRRCVARYTVRRGHLRWRHAHRLQLRPVRHLHTPGGGVGREERGGAERSGTSARVSVVRLVSLSYENVVQK